MEKEKYSLNKQEFNETHGQIREISKNDIAIIGIAVKMPMAENVEEFWSNLRKGKDCIIDFPESRGLDCDKYLHAKGEELFKYYKGGFLNEIDKFDYKFFKISPRDASLMDPAQKLFLETAWEVIEDAGYGGQKLFGSKTGVYFGFEPNIVNNYGRMIYDIQHSLSQMAIPANTPAIIPSRISYFLNLLGPTMVIDTACSSSLVAIHLACQGIKSGDCDMAIAGGIKIHLFPMDDPNTKIGIESSDFKTKAFDDSSDGTGNGEGVAAILLKPLARAIKDKDNIYAIIKGSAINQDGSSAGITAPNALAQADVIQQSWRQAGVHPDTISYIEAHGTGTKVGDPIEIDGIQKAFQRYTNKKQFCGIGSVKSNIGHLYEGSGIVGLIKVALALKNNEIPPTIHFEIPNQKVDFENSPVYIVDRLVAWESEGHPRRAGVNAFGFSGTNCHVILEEFPDFRMRVEKKEEELYVFTVSAKSTIALKRLLVKYKKYLDGDTNNGIKELCYATNLGRGHYNLRLALIVKSYDELKDKINKLVYLDIENEIIAGVIFAEHKTIENKSKRKEYEITEEEKKNMSNLSSSKLEVFIKNNKSDRNVLEEICQLYVKGAEVNWESIYEGEIIPKISLPTYPFDKTKCWLQLPEIEPVFDATGLYHTIIWEKEEAESNLHGLLNENILIFKDSAPNGVINEELLKDLRQKCKMLIEVEIGIEYKKINDQKFLIRNIEEDYLKLLNELEKRGRYSIIHSISLGIKDDTNSLTELKDKLEIGLYSLFFMSKALENSAKNEIKLFIISSFVNQVTGYENNIKPENASLFGLAKILERESPHIQCKCIDIDDNITNEKICVELFQTFRAGQVAYRNDSRYVEQFTEINLSSFKLNEPITIIEDGVYIITGGAGGIGLEVAKFLASKNRVNLVLIGRSKLPDREEWQEITRNEDIKLSNKIKAILEIEQNGSKVFYYSADISKEDEVEAVFNNIRCKIHNKISGIVHSAGLPAQGFISTKSREMFSNVVYPKVLGTWILEKMTQVDNLDFFIMFSSVATIFGAPGQGDYAAANSYLDSFGSLMKKKGRRSLVINWVQWLETGMAVETKANIDTIFKALSTQQGIHAFEELLSSSLDRVLVGEINYGNDLVFILDKMPFKMSSKIKHNLESQRNLSKNKNKHSSEKQIGEVILKGKDSKRYTDTERIIAQIWGEILGYDALDIYDNFFDLGGDSISAIKICNKIESAIGKKFTITEALNYTTISEVANYLEETNMNKTENIYLTLKPVIKQEYYPLSSAQKRLFALNQMYPNDINYNLADFFIMKEGFNKQKFEDVINELVKRHEILRTSINIVDNEVVQIVHDSIKFEFAYHDISKTENQDLYIKEMIREFVRPFNLETAPLFRMVVLRLNQQEHMISVDKHHIIWDAVSRNIFIKDFLSLYNGENLPEIKLQYKDYAVWQKGLIGKPLIKKQEEFWLNQFVGGIPVLNLPVDFPRPEIRTQQGDKVGFIANDEYTKALNNIAAKNKTTLYVVLLTCFYILLEKYSCQEDIIIGSVVLGRADQDLDNTIGMFVNTVALRNYPQGEKCFGNFLKEVKENVLKTFDNQELQFEELLEKLEITRDMSRNPLFDVMFVLQNIQKLEAKGFIPYEFDIKTSKYDLFLEAVESQNAISFNLEYSTDLFKRETVDRMAKDYLKILENIICNQNIAIKQIKLATNIIKEERAITEDIDFNF